MILAAIRSVFFNLYFFIWGLLGSMAVYVLVYLLKRQDKVGSACSNWCKGVDWGMRHIIGLDHHKEGWENLPSGPFILAARHQSAWETIQLPIWFPYSAIVLKEELLKIPFWGPCMKMFGAIPVSRSGQGSDLKKMLKAAKTYAHEGRAILIFPQGTRTPAHVKRPLQRGVGVLYEFLQIPVVPVDLDSGAFWGRHAFIKYPGTITVKAYPPIPPGLPREEMMEKLEKALGMASETESNKGE
jgi:1-acyl-sn-glycerol-3-phosphate acyltransferase